MALRYAGPSKKGTCGLTAGEHYISAFKTSPTFQAQQTFPEFAVGNIDGEGTHVPEAER